MPNVDKARYSDQSFVISPLISILSHLYQNPREKPSSIKFLYSARKGPSGNLTSILFFDRLRTLFEKERSAPNNSLEFFLTTESSQPAQPGKKSTRAASAQQLEADSVLPDRVWYRRLAEQDLLNAVGPVEQRNRTLVYVCGPPAMTDWYAISMLLLYHIFA